MAQRTVAPQLPGFEYVDWIGGGGFADVFRYRDALGRHVAVKVQHQGVDSTSSAAFTAEANLMAKLSNHPNIVSIFQAGVSGDDRPFLVMEECNTSHLGNRIANRPLSPSKAMEVTIQIAGAVETAHRLGILHRDIKPANILFTEFGRPALTDFGISVAGDSISAPSAMSPLWAPPEQYPDSSTPMSPASDVFSLAATMWAMLVGRSPLEEPGGANDRLSLKHRARTFAAPRTGRVEVPEVLERVLATALDRDPARRYSTALDFARALQGVQGELNESVTQIDVLAEAVEEETYDPELADTGTRVSGFMLIDPEGAGAEGTVNITSPSSGLTSPHTRSNPLGDPSVPAPSAPIAQHGRGVGTPGVRDFTAPAVPQAADHTVLDGALPQPEMPAPQPKKRAVGAIIAVVIAAALIAGGVFVASMFKEDDPIETQEPDQTTVVNGPLTMHVPAVEEAKGELTDDGASFRWVNPDPETGDKYLVEQLSSTDEQPLKTVDEPEVVVPEQAGNTCVNVSLRRGNGQLSAPVRVCAE